MGLSGTVSELGADVITGGSLGGLMSFRSETLIPTQNAIGRLAMAVAGAVNDQHNLGVDLGDVITKASLADAFRLALRQQGVRLAAPAAKG